MKRLRCRLGFHNWALKMKYVYGLFEDEPGDGRTYHYLDFLMKCGCGATELRRDPQRAREKAGDRRRP